MKKNGFSPPDFARSRTVDNTSIAFKIFMLTFTSIVGTAPAYIRELFVVFQS